MHQKKVPLFPFLKIKAAKGKLELFVFSNGMQVQNDKTDQAEVSHGGIF